MVKVSLCLITHNSARTLPSCLRSVQGQSLPFHQVLALDNASTDASASLLRTIPGLGLTKSPVNLGFAAGFNRLFAQADGEWILTLNPDARLAPDFNARLRGILDAPVDAAIGMIGPKILRARGDGLEPTDVLDSAGIRWSLLFRHLDMGSNKRDSGQFDAPARVFGPTGAAALYRRSALEAVALDGQVMDERFFVYREDADLAFRLQWKGLHCL
jgi:GT2 family glycosyltransferase